MQIIMYYLYVRFHCTVIIITYKHNQLKYNKNTVEKSDFIRL